MAKIFISYSSKDKGFVRQLATDLQELGHQPWLDEWEIKVGECIVTKIEEGVSSSDYVVLVLTPQSVSSGWVEREWKTAYWSEIEKREILFLPILLQDCEVPPLLKTKKYADFRKSYAVGLTQLIQPITSISLQEQKPVLIKTGKDDVEDSKLIEMVQGKQVQHSEDKMGNIIADLRVVSDKCNRDVDKKYPFNYEYYLRELNRILIELEQIAPETVEDIDLIEDAKHISSSTGSMTGEQDAKLREISAVADKLLSRLHRTINKQPSKVSAVGEEKTSISESKANWNTIEKEFGIRKTSFGRKINFVKDPFKRTIIFRDVEQAFVLASSGFSKPAVILAGGVIEELLRLYLEYKNILPLSDNFDGYIRTCEQHGLLKDSVSRLSHSVRQFRNLVHLSAEETKKHTISKSTAVGAVSSIFTIANDF